MATKSKSTEVTRKRHSQAFKNEALALAQKIGVSAAAQQLGLHESQLYGWRGKARSDQTRSAEELRLATENARLKRQLAEQAEELAIVKKAAACVL